MYQNNTTQTITRIMLSDNEFHVEFNRRYRIASVEVDEMFAEIHKQSLDPKRIAEARLYYKARSLGYFDRCASPAAPFPEWYDVRHRDVQRFLAANKQTRKSGTW
jgi:hypothetical protein